MCETFMKLRWPLRPVGLLCAKKPIQSPWIEQNSCKIIFYVHGMLNDFILIKKKKLKNKF
jgi:hypothetical protein